MKQQNQDSQRSEDRNVPTPRKKQGKWTEPMPRRTMLKVTVSGEFLVFKTVARAWKSGTLYANREELRKLNWKDQVIVKDCDDFAVFTRNHPRGTVVITFYWAQCSDGTNLTGKKNTVKIPWQGFSDFLERSADEDGPEKWAALSDDENHYPRLIFVNRKRLGEVVRNKRVRRKFSKFFRNAFRWPDSDVIHLYADFVPYSFTFREFRNGEECMYGGIILHRQEDMRNAYYSMHT